MYLLALILLISIKSCQKTELILFVKAVKVYHTKSPFSQFESRWLEHRPHFNIKNWRKREREREKKKKERKKESDWIQEWFLLASNENIIYLLQFHCSIVQREINFEIIFVVILCWNFKKYVFTPFRGSWNSSTAASWWSQWHQGIYYSKIMKSGWRLQVTWLVFANWSAQLGMLLTNLLMTPVTRIYSINT